MGRLQGDQNPQAPQPPEDQKPQAPQFRSEVPPTHQYPPSNAAPAVGYQPQGPEIPAQFPYQPPGAAAAYPPPPQDQHQAVPFPPNASPSNVQPAGYMPQGSEKPARFYGQPPGAAVAYPPASQPQHQAVPFPPNAPQPYNVNQAAAFKPQPVTYAVAEGQPHPQPPHGQATFGGYGAHLGSAQWTTGLFDCMEDPTSALITACFPCVTFGQIAEILDNGTTPCLTSGIIYGALAWLGVPCILSCSYRTRLRARYGLLEAPAPDLITHCLCEWCSLCQEYRELRNRGMDPGIGWQANMMLQAQRQQVAMTPPVHQTMAAPLSCKNCDLEFNSRQVNSFGSSSILLRVILSQLI